MQKIAEKLNTLSRYSTVVTDRQTDDRHATDGIAMTIAERNVVTFG